MKKTVDFKQIEKILNSLNKEEFDERDEAFNLALATAKYEIEKLFRSAGKQQQERSVNAAQSLDNLLQTEFGRPLSPIELEILSNWINVDKYDQGVVRMAIREAVANRAYSLQYIDKILLSWERKNIRTEQDAINEIEGRRRRVVKNSPTAEIPKKDLPKVSMHNYLNPTKKD